jgi:hypothetical protein
MFSAILILLLLPFMDISKSRGMQFRPLSKIGFFIFIANFLILMQLGAKHVESPYIELGQMATLVYFLYFAAAMFGNTLFENTYFAIAPHNHTSPYIYLDKPVLQSSIGTTIKSIYYVLLYKINHLTRRQ